MKIILCSQGVGGGGQSRSKYYVLSLQYVRKGLGGGGQKRQNACKSTMYTITNGISCG